MPHFTIQATYHLPVFRHRTYCTDTYAEALESAMADDDWSLGKEDRDGAGTAYLTGAWAGEDTAYKGDPLPIPSRYDDPKQRKATYFDELQFALERATHGRTLPMDIYIALRNAQAIVRGEDLPDPRKLSSTPWGMADDVKIYAEGVLFFQTPSHGGFYLSAECNAAMCEAWRTSNRWYEEDCEWAKVALTFPHLFKPDELPLAEKARDAFFPSSTETANLGVQTTEGGQ